MVVRRVEHLESIREDIFVCAPTWVDCGEACSLTRAPPSLEAPNTPVTDSRSRQHTLQATMAEPDARMTSSPDLTDDASTPQDQLTSSSILSPPDSQHRSHTTTTTTTMPHLTSSANANANGKRPLTSLSNDIVDLTSEAESAMAELTAGTMGGKQQQQPHFPPKTHQPSGYTWTRHEDEPGWAWGNKKAVDERGRAWEGMAHRELMVRSECCPYPHEEVR
jgi:hypothetical protein